MVNLVIALDLNGGIGKNNALPWPYHKEDMKWFRDNTLNSVVIMGKNTWNSLPTKPLKDRQNLVVTSDLSIPYNITIEQFYKIIYSNDDSYVINIIGGAKLYNYCLDLNVVKKVFLTTFKQNYDCDTFVSKQKLLVNKKMTYQKLTDSCDYEVWELV